MNKTTITPKNLSFRKPKSDFVRLSLDDNKLVVMLYSNDDEMYLTYEEAKEISEKLKDVL